MSTTGWSGVDVLDKVVRTYSCKRATARWTVTFFLNMVDIAAYNALVLWITRNVQWNQGKSCARREFLRELGMQLVSGHAVERTSLSSSKRRRIREVTRQSGIGGVIASERSKRSTDESDVRRRRCSMCHRRLKRKTTRSCDICGSSICKEHRGEVITRCQAWADAVTVGVAETVSDSDTCC